MDSSPKLSGETLIVHHIPLVHCQVSGRREGSCAGSLKRSNPFSLPENLGLSRTTSLPERDVFQKESLLYSSLIQTSSSHWSSQNGGKEKKGSRRGGSTASDDSSFTSSNSEDQLITAHTLPRAKPRSRNPFRHNPFLLNTEDDEDDDEDDHDNLSGYHEDSSFHLHSDTTLPEGLVPFHLHDFGFASEPFRLHSLTGGGSHESLGGGVSDLSNNLEDINILGLRDQRRHGSSGSNMSMDCGEQDWGDDEEEEDHQMRCGRSSKAGSYSSGCSTQHCSCCALSQHYPEAFSECQQGYGSDSSCNSSDGVLVNFSAIYNKMNNSVPEKPAGPNLNSSTDHSCTSSASDPPLHQEDLTGGAFYLDLHTSPTEPVFSQQQTSCIGNSFPANQAPNLSTFSTCSCSVEHQGALDLDANCNSYQPPHFGSSGDLAACLQSQARLVVATQNYYKLVTCDLSSQSSPSPAGSSVHSCSDEHSKGSPTPPQPSEYYLFRQQEEEEDEDEEDTSRKKHFHEEDDETDEEKKEEKPHRAEAVINGQVYINVSPPLVDEGLDGASSSTSRLRSRSYDRHLDKSPARRLGSLERMLSCPVRLSEGTTQTPPPPPRVTSFAEIARSKRRNGGSPPQKTAADPFTSNISCHSHSSADFSPIVEQHLEAHSSAPAPFTRCYSQGSIERTLEGGRETRSRTEGGPSCSIENIPAVVRYRKDQRPTSLPIQPFTFHHQFTSKPPQPKPLLPLLTGYVPGMQACSSSGSGSGGAEEEEDAHTSPVTTTHPPGSVRPSPLGSYSPVPLQRASSSGTCSTCTPSPKPPHSPACLLSGGQHTPQTARHSTGSGPLPLTPPPPSLGVKRGVVPPTLPAVPGHCFRGSLSSLPALQSDTLSPLGFESGKADACKAPGVRSHNAHHLSPQALKWREYRRRNPLGVERVSSSQSSPGVIAEPHRGVALRPARPNVFDFPPVPPRHAPGRLNGGHTGKQLQQSHNDFLPDYFSLAEKPPEEFCLSPDASTSSSSCSSSQSQISVDLTQKRGLVKAVNTAVDLIVAHFGTSRDPDVKAKLGNSWVSPNVGHLVLKYLCPAIHEVLQDGLKAYVLDLIIGQCRCQPWSLVEASTQLGPSTRVLHSLFTKVSQFSELTSHRMRLNAFIFGLLNLKSLEFWFNHLYTHEDIIAAHYNPWGLLPLSQGACQPLFEELLLLLQPLSVLPFDLDLLFEPRLLQKGQEQLRRKEQLCSAVQSTDRTSRSTFQLMRGWSTTVSEMVRDSHGDGKRESKGLRREGTWPRMEVTGVKSLLRKEEVQRDQRGKGEQEDRRKEVTDRQAGWWYQLMQSSQVYIDQSTEGSKFVKTEKRRRSSERRQQPPAREGVVEGAESSQEGDGRSGGKSSSSSADSAGSGGRSSWMGSPPESVLTQETSGVEDQSTSQGQSLRWGRLFGSSLGSPSKTETIDTTEPKPKPKTRAPSGWLGLDRSVLGLVALTIGAGSGKKSDPAVHPSPPPSVTPPRPPTCEVRALCHHIATEPGQLSFNKGDVLRVLGKADPEWLMCSLDSRQGLVPIIYVTLTSMEESRELQQ